jgi:hypothetical protein
MKPTAPAEVSESDASRWVNTWIAASPALEKVRSRDVREADTAAALRSFTGSVLNTVRTHPPAPTSGLVEQQQLFRKFAAS